MLAEVLFYLFFAAGLAAMVLLIVWAWGGAGEGEGR
jgi:hypothetical protein